MAEKQDSDAPGTDPMSNVDREFRALLARMTGGISPQDYGTAFADWWLHFVASPAKQLAVQQSAINKALDLWMFTTQAMQGQPLAPNDPGHRDQRFAADVWQMFPFNVYARAYQNSSKFVQDSVSGVDGVQERNAQLMGFALQQVAEAVSPANYPGSNPEVIQKTLDEKGAIYSLGGLRKEWLPGHLKFVEILEGEGYKLRYSGGFVPDINQILIKRGGVFTYPGTKKDLKGKLRLIFELQPMAFLAEQAGGMATDGKQDILAIKPENLNHRSPIYIGSRYEVEKAREFLA